MAAPARWEASFAEERFPLLLWGLCRSIFATYPADHRREYYRAIATAVAYAARYHGVRPVERFLREELWVRYDGLEYLLTPESLFGYFLHALEPRTAQDLRRRSGELFLDLGANTGQYTLPLARRFRRVIAVEPNPIAAGILRRNADRNGLRNVTVIERAVAPRRGPIRLFAGEVLTTWGTHDVSERHVEVEAVTLDDLLGEHPRVDLVKLDIEGLEASVLCSTRGLDRVGTISFAGFPADLPSTRSYLESFGFSVRLPEPLFRSIENYVAERPAAGD
jgi:FkbM family methyltransferase